MVVMHGVSFYGKYECISLPDVSVLLPVTSLKEFSTIHAYVLVLAVSSVLYNEWYLLGDEFP